MEPEPEEQLDTTATEGGSSGHQMQIFVCTTTGRTIALSVHGSDTGAEVKALIQAAEGVPPEQQGLFFGKEQLEDDRKLADCGVPKEGTLRLKLISGDGSGSAASGLTERSSSHTSKQQLRERGASFIRSDGRTFNSAAGLFDRADTSETGSGSALAKGMYREEEDEALCNINLGSCTKGTAMITLCLIDLGHVFLTWLNMWSLAHEQEEKFCGNTTVQANDTGAHEFDNLKENARTCMWLYTFKVVTHFSLVCLRMLCNRGLVTPSDNTNRWRVTQDWFIAMTFNSFMMLFVRSAFPVLPRRISTHATIVQMDSSTLFAD
jgi:ubiquitin